MHRSGVPLKVIQKISGHKTLSALQKYLEVLDEDLESAISLGKPASYVERIREVTADYQRGLPLSEKTIAARQQDLAAYQRQIQAQRGQGGLSL